MIDRDSVEEEISKLLRDEISLEQFEEWLSSASWSMHSDSPLAAIELVSSVHHLLDERDDGIIEESALREELRSLVHSVLYVPIVVGDATRPYLVSRWSSNQPTVSFVFARA